MFIRLRRAPPIDVFPLYLPVRRTQTGDEQPGPSTDDYTCPPLEDHQSGLVRLWRITLQSPIFKTTLGQARLPMPKIATFQPI